MKRKKAQERVDINEKEYDGLMGRVERRELNDQDWKWILTILQTFRFLQNVLQKNSISLSKLKNLIFGSKSEKDKTPPPDQNAGGGAMGSDVPSTATPPTKKSDDSAKNDLTDSPLETSPKPKAPARLFHHRLESMQST
jgi:hypothetical protein